MFLHAAMPMLTSPSISLSHALSCQRNVFLIEASNAVFRQWTSAVVLWRPASARRISEGELTVLSLTKWSQLDSSRQQRAEAACTFCL